jgi:hypothetical protein
MTKRFSLFFLVFIFLSPASLLPQGRIFSWIETPPQESEIYEHLEFRFDLDAKVANPYNSDEIRIDMEILAPDHKRHVIPAFYLQSFQKGSDNTWQPSGFSWNVRFTPDHPGKHLYYLLITHKGSIRKTEIFEFTVKPESNNNNRGFIRSSENSYLVFDNGEAFFATGFNLAHPGRSQPLDYEYFFAKMAEAGMNYTRIWLAPPWGPHALTLEWTDDQFPSQKGLLGLHRINQEVAWRIDEIMKLAEKYGIFVMFCLGDERELETGIARGATLSEGRSFWHANPYNIENGGPARTPLEFFTDEHAKRIYKDRLRYIVARWGYSPNLFAWQFWNEIDHPSWAQEWKFVEKSVAAWHEEMGRYLYETDPFGHFITSSFLGNQPMIWHRNVFSLVQSHGYGGGRNMAEVALNVTGRMKSNYPFKPFYIGEFGTDFRGFTSEGNAESVAIHNTLWASALSGATGTAMWWWWNSIDQADLYQLYRNLQGFIGNIPWVGTRELDIETNNENILAVGRSAEQNQAWIWVHNRNNNWTNARDGVINDSLHQLVIAINGLMPGEYVVSEYNTHEGRFTGQKRVSSDGIMNILIEVLDTDRAFHIGRVF